VDEEGKGEGKLKAGSNEGMGGIDCFIGDAEDRI
jgi:hypothetical protein